MEHLSRLDLSEQQSIDIRRIVEAGIESSKEKRATLKVLHLKMKKMRNAEEIDESGIKALSAEIAEIKSDMLILHLNKRKQVEELLTDLQKDKLQKMKNMRKKGSRNH
jgi:Spy/CpxP family protein refolding chaperone